jgi:hypothetical protein
VSTSDAGLDERCAAKDSRQINIRDSGEGQSRHGESGRATGDQVRGHSHDADYRQGSTQNAGTQVADEENVGCDVARYASKSATGGWWVSVLSPSRNPYAGDSQRPIRAAAGLLHGVIQSAGAKLAMIAWLSSLGRVN